MGAFEIQYALARLIVDDEARGRVEVDPASLVAEYGLDAAEATAVHSVLVENRPGVELTARLSMRKRGARARNGAPALGKLWGRDRWEAMWREHAEPTPIEVAPSAEEDCLQFLRRLEREAVLTESELALAALDRGRLEVLLLPPSAPLPAEAVELGELNRCYPTARKPWRLIVLPDDPARLTAGPAPGLASSSRETRVPATPTLVLVFRTRHGSVATARVTTAVARLVAGSDGSRSVGELVTGSSQQWTLVLQRLVERGVLDLAAEPCRSDR